MSSMFTNTVLANAKSAQADGKLDQFLGGLVTLGFATDAETAGKAFEAALEAERAAILVKRQGEARETASALVSGFSFPKSMAGLLVKVGKVLAEAEVKTWGINLSLDSETGELKAGLTAGAAARSRSSAPRSSGGKARLDGKPLNAKLLREEYPDSVAGRIMANKCCPYGIVQKQGGGDYSEGSRMNATQAVKADKVLRERLTFDGE